MSCKLENLTWVEAEKALLEVDFLTIPLGARLKEHGPHLPLKNDWIIADYFSGKIGQNYNTLCTPCIENFYYPAFVDYPGSVSLSFSTAKNYMLDYVNSFTRHGVTQFYVMNTGLSTAKVLAELKEILAERDINFSYFDISCLEARESELCEQPEGTHADEVETSMMMAIESETQQNIVHHDRLVKDIHPKLAPGPFRREKSMGGRYSPTGVYGDATKASLEKGRKILDLYWANIQKSIASSMS